MEGGTHSVVEELRRAIAQTPNEAERSRLLDKLAVLEGELGELQRRQQAFDDASAHLAQARGTQVFWRIVTTALVTVLIALAIWFVANLSGVLASGQ